MVRFTATLRASYVNLWAKMFSITTTSGKKFLRHYHKRSNLETTVQMIKAKFRERLRSKTERRRKMRLCASVLCHNLCVIIQSIVRTGHHARVYGSGIKVRKESTHTQNGYRVEPQWADTNAFDYLNQLGAQGWELVSTSEITGKKNTVWFYFKRPLKRT